jgi:hypothetical protein
MKRNKSRKNIKRKTLHNRNKGFSSKKGTLSGVNCSPRGSDPYTCYTKKSLKKIAEFVNVENEFTSNFESIRLKSSKRELWNSLDDRLNNVCKTEECWLKRMKSMGGGNEIEKDSFKPGMPSKWYSNPKEWLNNYDIVNVMKQYEQAYPDFHFIGPVPADYYFRTKSGRCVGYELCDFKVERWLNEGFKRIGIILNLDAHDMPGSHWVALFFDLRRCNAYYYDSFGVEPEKDVMDLMQRVTSETSRLSGDAAGVHVNELRHQYQNTECGIYAIYFIVHMLESESNFNEMIEKAPTDKEMNKFRQVFYRKNFI